jgi:hypothetical protein
MGLLATPRPIKFGAFGSARALRALCALCTHHYWNHCPVPSSWETPTKRRPQDHLIHLARKVKATLWKIDE